MRKADFVDGVLQIRQGKVARHGHGHIRLHAGPRLQQVIKALTAASPTEFLIYRPTQRRMPGAAPDSWLTAVDPKKLTRTFAKLRDQIPRIAAMEADQRPSFHEIRALGADYRRQSGWSQDQVQRLLGHSKASTTSLYLDGHGERWAEVQDDAT